MRGGATQHRGSRRTFGKMEARRSGAQLPAKRCGTPRCAVRPCASLPLSSPLFSGRVLRCRKPEGQLRGRHTARTADTGMRFLWPLLPRSCAARAPLLRADWLPGGACRNPRAAGAAACTWRFRQADMRRGARTAWECGLPYDARGMARRGASRVSKDHSRKPGVGDGGLAGRAPAIPDGRLGAVAQGARHAAATISAMSRGR